MEKHATGIRSMPENHNRWRCKIKDNLTSLSLSMIRSLRSIRYSHCSKSGKQPTNSDEMKWNEKISSDFRWVVSFLSQIRCDSSFFRWCSLFFSHLLMARIIWLHLPLRPSMAIFTIPGIQFLFLFYFSLGSWLLNWGLVVNSMVFWNNWEENLDGGGEGWF